MTSPITNSLIGVSNDRTTTSPEHILGTVVIGNGTDYVYAQAASALAAAATFGLTAGYASTTGTDHTHDVGGSGVPSGSYFWAKKVATPF